MIRIILCEGETDCIILSYFLDKMAGWKYMKRSKVFNPIFSEQDNRCFAAYKNDADEELFICGVGGKDGFKSFSEDYIKELIWLSLNNETEFKIALITDRDDMTGKEIEENIKCQLASILQNVSENSWTENSFVNSFGNVAKVEFLLIAIPQKEAGALETLLMNALSEDEYDANIVEKSKEFVAYISPNSQRYISTKRLLLKSQLGVVLSIINPEKIFYLFDERLKSVKWENYKSITKCFSKLLDM